MFSKQSFTEPVATKEDLNLLFKLRDSLVILNRYFLSNKTLGEIKEVVDKEIQTYVGGHL